MRIWMPSLVIAALMAGLPPPSPQGPPPGPDMTIDPATRTTVVEGVVNALHEFYVYPEFGAKIADAIRQHQQMHDYDTITSAQKFADTLTTDLQSVSQRGHAHGLGGRGHRAGRQSAG